MPPRTFLGKRFPAVVPLALAMRQTLGFSGVLGSDAVGSEEIFKISFYLVTFRLIVCSKLVKSGYAWFSGDRLGVAATQPPL